MGGVFIYKYVYIYMKFLHIYVMMIIAFIITLGEIM